MSQEVLHLVASVPRGPDAIRDYAIALATGLRRHGITSSFLAVTGEGADEAGAFGRASLAVRRRSADALLRGLEEVGRRVVLLHHSGYGFARRGAPFWLARGLAQWKARGGDRRLLIMFHELWASGPVWRSSFWTSPLQRMVVARLLGLADLWMTSAEVHSARLRELAPSQRAAACLPVFSNVGEAAPSTFDDRPLSAAVFGQEGRRRLVYANLTAFEPVLGAHGIDRLVDIGPGDAVDPRPGLPVTRLGYLPPEGVAAALGQCRLGLLSYPLNYVAKSGIFAAYAAHGLAPVLQSRTQGCCDGLRPGVNLITTSCGASSRQPASVIAAAAAAWYRNHDLLRTSATFAGALREVGVTPCGS